MMVQRTKHRITWKGQEYELGITAISKLTNKSTTFLNARLHEGMTAQQAVDAQPGDPRFKKKRRKQHLRGQEWLIECDRKKREEQIRQDNLHIINSFFGVRSCCR